MKLMFYTLITSLLVEGDNQYCTYYDKYPTDLCSIQSVSKVSKSKSSKKFLCVYDDINLNWNIEHNIYDSLDCDESTIILSISILCEDGDTKCHCRWDSSGHNCNTSTVRNRGYIYGECDMNSYTDEIIVTDECVNGVEYNCKSDSYDALFVDTFKCNNNKSDVAMHASQFSYNLNECATVSCNNTFDKMYASSKKYIEYSTYFGDNCSHSTEWTQWIQERVSRECLPFGLFGGSYKYSCNKGKETVSLELWNDIANCDADPDFSQTATVKCTNDTFIAIQHCDSVSKCFVFHVFITVLIIMLQLQ